jgi:4,5-dihydroxyphthalate decarboxylase
MANDLAFDLSEMALVTLMLAHAQARPITGIPVLMMRQTALGMFVCTQDSPIHAPQDLHGRTIGVRAYTQTTGVWTRGILEEQFGVDLARLRWATFEAAHLDGYDDPPNCTRAPDGKTLLDMLLAGDIDAAMGLTLNDYPSLRTVVPDVAAAERAWYGRTGVDPINHMLVVKSELDTAHPWLRTDLYRLFETAKAEAGGGPPSGLEVNRRAMETLARFAHRQGITARAYAPQEILPPL